MTDKENRRAPRKNHNSVIEIFDAVGNDITEIGRLIDFSEVGACFASTKVFAVGKKLRLRLRLLREGRLYIQARIIWAKKVGNTNHYGIEFLKVYDVA